MNKAFQVIAWFSILSAICLLLLFGYWLFYPYQPLVFLNHPFEVTQTSVMPGDLLTYHTDYCKNSHIPAIVTRSFVDGIKYTEPSTVSNNQTGCHELYPTLPVPNIPPGNYYLKITYLYQVNPIRQIEVDATSSAFVVTKIVTELGK